MSTPMKWTLLILVPLLLAACGKTERRVGAELDANFAKGEVLLTCKVSTSGTCHALFLVDTQRVTLQAAAGSAASASGVGEGALYCVGVGAPDPAKCRPRPLVQGKQIVHSATVKS
jgi:hypothetical protein